MDSAIIFEERRHTPRTKLNHIAYMSFKSGNGAIVLDVSQGGLGFHSAVPLEADNLIRFRISEKSVDSIEVSGELAWKDQTNKSGGLRFTTIPDKFREQILLSLGQPAPPLSSRRVIQDVPAARDSVLPNPSGGAQSSGQNQSISAPAIKVVMPNFPLRERLLVLVGLAAIGLNGITAFSVHRLVQNRIQQDLIGETGNALLASETVFQQAETALRHKADLLGTLVAVTPSDDMTLQNTLDDPFTDDGSDLIAVTDGTNQITALHTTDRSMTATTAQEMVLQSLQREAVSDWWFVNGRLYQVVLQSQDHRPLRGNTSGTVVVGRQLDDTSVHYLKNTTASDVAFLYGGDVIESSLNRFDQNEFAQKVPAPAGAEQLQIDGKPFYVRSVKLANGPIRYAVLKSTEVSTGFLNNLKGLLLRVGEIETMILLALAIIVLKYIPNRSTGRG